MNIILFLESFSHQRYLMVFHESLSDSKSLWVFKTFLSILTNCGLGGINFSSDFQFLQSLLSRSLRTISSTLTTICISVTFILFSGEVQAFIFSFSLIFTLWSTRTVKSNRLLLFSPCWTIKGLVVWPGLGDSFVSQNPGEFYTTHSRGWIPLVLYSFVLVYYIRLSRD